MKIAITRLENKAAGDRALCATYGHDCYTVSPLRADLRPDRIDTFVEAVHRGEFDCLFFSSALPAAVVGPKLERWPRVIAIGPKTAEVLRGFGIEAEVLPTFYSRDFVPYLGDWLRGRTVGIPRADVPNPDLLDAIAAAGGTVREERVYALVPTGTELALDAADAALFTSAMSYREARWRPRDDLLLIAIGEITADAMRAGGHPPAVVGDGSLAGTLEALNLHAEGR
ncbi:MULTISPECIES: uroporphyrinogen-III synthase [Methanoculleus]|jgi:uroporphyrinogen-III synthase|uniref:Uroporphyrinogen III synthase HEM4 n=2 Tax=Methanoculleus TaxID=45989 RepID=A3CSX2_METMJ|nr:MULTISPECIES: uroporphyrinogen-III synthase [Methanoculleus]ABN56472.1 Uroporphyrinogen III synthase HEM4 [Methanoculleus marisnigri JR1]MCC7554947.1 uroporphyrinogen-III synthase [Methanoculleus marisnigri]UYU17914.1 uroporphyrinogen-III synthase [Methanoculleus submarinus]